MKIKLSLTNKIKIACTIIFFLVNIPSGIKFFGLNSDFRKKVDFIKANPTQFTGIAEYTNYNGKDIKGTVEADFFESLITKMQYKPVKRYTSGEGFELYIIKMFYENDFFMNCHLGYWRVDNLLEISFFDEEGYTYRICYKITEEEMDMLCELITLE